MAEGVKVQGDLFHGRIPDGAVYVGRPAPWLPGSKFRNPYGVGRAGLGGIMVLDAEHAVELYEQRLVVRPDLVAAARAELAGRDLACWCALDRPCHRTVLLRVARGEDP